MLVFTTVVQWVEIKDYYNLTVYFQLSQAGYIYIYIGPIIPASQHRYGYILV